MALCSHAFRDAAVSLVHQTPIGFLAGRRTVVDHPATGTGAHREIRTQAIRAGGLKRWRVGKHDACAREAGDEPAGLDRAGRYQEAPARCGRCACQLKPSWYVHFGVASALKNSRTLVRGFDRGVASRECDAAMADADAANPAGNSRGTGGVDYIRDSPIQVRLCNPLQHHYRNSKSLYKTITYVQVFHYYLTLETRIIVIRASGSKPPFLIATNRPTWPVP